MTLDDDNSIALGDLATMTRIIFMCVGGTVCLPDPRLVLADRADGGALIVNPLREVWERNELSAAELGRWSYLVAATGSAMLHCLPQLDGGCINYWEAGNWALNERAEPLGRKIAAEHRKVHLHLLGRSPASRNPNWLWGEAPTFPRFADRYDWAAGNQRLAPVETQAIAQQVSSTLQQRYGFTLDEISPTEACAACLHPFVAKGVRGLCAECIPGPSPEMDRASR